MLLILSGIRKYVKNKFGDCIELEKLYDACWWEMQRLGDGLQTLWIPVSSREYKAIPEHARWYRKFKKHKSKCFDCQPL
jgi:hypothetical protein